MKSKEVRELSPAEIEKKLRDTREELLQLRLRKTSGQLETPHLLRKLRKDIARMETILAQKNTTTAKAVA